MERTNLAWMESISASVRATEGYLRPKTAFMTSETRERRHFEASSELQYSLNAMKITLQRHIQASFRPLESELMTAEVKLRVIEATKLGEIVQIT